MTLDAKTADAVYTILVLHLGANEDGRAAFIQATSKEAPLLGHVINGTVDAVLLINSNGFTLKPLYDQANRNAEDRAAVDNIVAQAEHELTVEFSRNFYNTVANLLYRRYDRAFKMRYLKLRSTNFSADPVANERLAVLFCYSNPPCSVYARLVMHDDAVLVQRYVAKDTQTIKKQTRFESFGRVSYDDPDMLVVLDRLVRRIVTSTSRLETV